MNSPRRTMRISDSEWQTMQAIAKREGRNVSEITRELWARTYPGELALSPRTGGRLPDELEDWGWIVLDDGSKALSNDSYVYQEISRDAEFVYLEDVEELGQKAKLSVAHFALLMNEENER